MEQKYSRETLVAIWQKGQAVGNNDPAIWRKDVYGTWMKWSKYGDRNSEYGWEIDHITPVDQGGTNDLSNLRPLQWENNVQRAKSRLSQLTNR